MIVKNEAHQLEEILQQVRAIADEIVIVDTGSEDNTVEVAKRYTTRVFFLPWQDDFSLARNFALQQARGNYFMWLDADDRIPQDSVKKIALLKNYFDGKTFFSFILEDMKGDKVQSRFYQVRCAPLRDHIRFRYKIHEELISSLREGGYRGVTTDIVIRHYGYSEPTILSRKMERNLNLLLADFETRKDNVDYIFLLAVSFLYFEQFDEAYSVLQQYLERKRHGAEHPATLCEIYRLLAHIELLRDNRSEAIRHLVKAEAIGIPGKAEWYRLGCTYEYIGELARALHAFRRTLTAPYLVGPVPTIPEPPEWEIYLRKTAILYRQKKDEEARRFFKMAMGTDTGEKDPAQWLVKHLLRMEEYELAERLIKTDFKEYLNVSERNFYLALVYLFSNRANEAFKALFSALENSKQNVNLRRAIAASYLITGQYHRALRIYRELLAEGIKAKDVLAGGIFSSIMRKGQHIDLFIKELQHTPETTCERFNTAKISDLLVKLLKYGEHQEDFLSLLLVKLVMKAIQKSQI